MLHVIGAVAFPLPLPPSLTRREVSPTQKVRLKHSHSYRYPIGKGVRQTNDFEERVRSLIQASIAIKQKLLQDVALVSSLAEVSKVIADALFQGNKVILCGNAGSAAAEFVGRFAFDRPALPALALSVNTSCVTAIGNDYGFDLVFSRQIEALGRKGDVAIGISTSDNSANVLNAMSTSRRLSLSTIALTGCTGGETQERSRFLSLCAVERDAAYSGVQYLDGPHY
jgi:D-sedoheptulose 7-phosphate isomerase